MLCEDIFWVIVSSGSGPIRATIDNIANEIHAMFDAAEDYLRKFGEEPTAQLRDALVRGKGIALAQLEKNSRLATTPDYSGLVALDNEALIKVSLSVIQGFYNAFRPRITVNAISNMQIPGAVRWFSDAFFILFENVMKYSGNSVDPEITINFKEERDYLTFEVVNSVDVMSKEQIGRIDRAHQRIKDGSFRHQFVAKGGRAYLSWQKLLGSEKVAS